MSIASEITRLQGVKADILTAIGNKGVVVPTGSALEDCPGLIGDIGGYAQNNKNLMDVVSTFPWFYSPSFDFDSAQVIEENIVCKAEGFSHGTDYHNCGGMWFTGTQSYFYGIAPYIFSDKIAFDYGNQSEDFVTGVSYSLSNWIRKNIIYDKNTGYATCKIYYDDTLVCTHTIPMSSLRFGSNVCYALGGVRYNGSLTYCFNGYIDFNKSYFRIDGKLVWGCDSLKSEAIIGGKRYKTVVMPDGKEWLAENLDFKFCNIGGSGTPSTANAWYYDNNETTYGWNGYKCGLLYNWYAAKFLNDYRSDLCPGWHVPTKDEWDTLVTACGGASVAGTKLKALDGSAVTNWPSGWNGTDDFGFNALPSGYYRGNPMVFEGINTDADFITLTSINSTSNYDYYINVSGSVGNFQDDKTSCCSIRLVRDT